MEVIILSDNLNCAGVYKLIFPNGKYYIGSTSNFKKRVSAFRAEFKRGYSHNKKLAAELSMNESVSFCVVEHIDDFSMLKHKEDYYLKLCSNDSHMLNRSKNAFSNKGVIWTKEEKKLMSANSSRKGRPRIHFNKKEKTGAKKIKVNAYNISGILIGSYDSIKDAAISLGVNRGAVSKVVSNKCKRTKGFVFKKHIVH